MRHKGLVLALAGGLALGVGGCCLDDDSDCDSDGDCCSDYCDPDSGVCVAAAPARMRRATRDQSRALAQRTERPQARLSLQCLKKRLAQ